MRVSSRSRGSWPQTQTGSSGGQMQPRASAAKNRFTIRSSSEWKLMTASAPARPEHLDRRRQRSLESAELVVHGDPERLEHTPRRVAVAEAPRGRDASADRVDELRRALVGPLRAAADDGARDLAREALLAVAAEQLGELALVGLVDEVAGRERRGRIHAHVERRVDRVREPALGPVDLHARDAEVEQDRVRADAVRGELREHRVEAAAQEARLDAGAPGEPVEVRAHGGVAIDRHEPPAPIEVRGQERRVAAGAERGVDDGLPGLDREEIPDLLREHGDVVSRAVRRGVRQHCRHSLPLARGAGARRRDPRSRRGRGHPRRRPRARAARA